MSLGTLPCSAFNGVKDRAVTHAPRSSQLAIADTATRIGCSDSSYLLFGKFGVSMLGAMPDSSFRVPVGVISDLGS